MDDILLGKEMIIDVNEEFQNKVASVKEELKEMMQCPKCKDSMIRPIFECLAGHSICSDCKNIQPLFLIS